MFQLGWGTKQFNAFLHNLFPKLFAYLGTTNPGFAALPDKSDKNGMMWVEYSLPYVLLFKVRKTYSIINTTHPDATKYMEVVNGLKDSPRVSNLEDGQKDSSRKSSSFWAKSIFFGEYRYILGTLMDIL